MTAVAAPDWFPKQVFDGFFHDLRGKPNLRFLEIGALEGRGTLYFLETFLQESGAIVCVDPFLPYSVATVAKIEGFDQYINEQTLSVFVSNTKKYAGQVTLIKGLSKDVLPYLKPDTFDLSFIDGDHSRDAVAVDATESLRVVKSGGYIVFDDYSWRTEPEMSPKDAVDEFLKVNADRIRLIDQGQRVVIVQKL